MLIFHCTDCDQKIQCADGEDPDQVHAKLDEHIAKCPLATFNIEATTEWAKDIAEVIRSAIKKERLAGRLRPH